jgi:hypothetical protein
LLVHLCCQLINRDWLLNWDILFHILFLCSESFGFCGGSFFSIELFSRLDDGSVLGLPGILLQVLAEDTDSCETTILHLV